MSRQPLPVSLVCWTCAGASLVALDDRRTQFRLHRLESLPRSLRRSTVSGAASRITITSRRFCGAKGEEVTTVVKVAMVLASLAAAICWL
jgi:hypothetical protein